MTVSQLCVFFNLRNRRNSVCRPLSVIPYYTFWFMQGKLWIRQLIEQLLLLLQWLIKQYTSIVQSGSTVLHTYTTIILCINVLCDKFRTCNNNTARSKYIPTIHSSVILQVNILFSVTVISSYKYGWITLKGKMNRQIRSTSNSRLNGISIWNVKFSDSTCCVHNSIVLLLKSLGVIWGHILCREIVVFFTLLVN